MIFDFMSDFILRVDGLTYSSKVWLRTVCFDVKRGKVPVLDGRADVECVEAGLVSVGPQGLCIPGDIMDLVFVRGYLDVFRRELGDWLPANWRKHCDGRDCRCCAESASQCACDVDWTPFKVYEIRDVLAHEVARLEAYLPGGVKCV